MDVFIGNLPGSATLIELFSFLEGMDLRREFQCFQGRDGESRGYHFVVARTTSREQGMALINRLRGQCFEGQAIEVREYQRRRLVLAWRGQERRVNPW